MTLSHKASNFGFPTFTGGKVQCYSDVELWIKRYDYIPSIEKICYSVGSSPVQVCYTGNRYQTSSKESSNQGGYFSCEYRYTRQNWSGYWSDWASEGTYVTAPWEFLGWVSGFSGFDYALVIKTLDYPTGYPLTILPNSTNPVVGRETRNPKINGIDVPPTYNLKIFNDQILVHETNSSQPFNVTEEVIPERCSAENSPWQKTHTWQMYPTDELISYKQNDCVYFAVQGYFFGTPNKRNARPIGPVIQSYLVAAVCQGDDCAFPLFRTEVKPYPGTDCYDDKKPPENCKPGTYWDDDREECRPVPPPKCPPGTEEEYRCNGYLCCYDECGNLKASFKL